MTIHVRPAALADAAALSRFGAETFRATFERDNTPENMARFLAATYTPALQAAEIADPSNAILIAEDGNVMIGFVHLAAAATPEAVRGERPIEIKRLYVGHAWHGRGVAQSLMNAALDAARTRGARTVWLGVWERNPRAIAFYEKCGFARVGQHTFMLGDDAQTDWILARPVDPRPSARGG